MSIERFFIRLLTRPFRKRPSPSQSQLREKVVDPPNSHSTDTKVNTMSSSGRSALILIADGTEEMEFTITYDTLVRAGISCTSAFVAAPAEPTLSYGGSTAPPFAKGSRGINILPDMYFSPVDCTPEMYDALIIPGGAKGAETMSGSSPVQHLVREFLEQGKVVGMICAGSLAAKTSGLEKQPLTSHPSVKSSLDQHFDYSEESVVVSGKLVTSRGPGTTFPFALTLVEMLCGKEKREGVRGPMVFPEGTPW